MWKIYFKNFELHIRRPPAHSKFDLITPEGRSYNRVVISEETPFVTKRRSEKVQNFLSENPEADWGTGLSFLVENYPQVKDDSIQWILEGGAAVKLYNPDRSEPGDLDIVTRGSELEAEFANSRLFDAKSVQFWLERRGLESTQEAKELVFGQVVPIELDDKELLVMSPALLVVSKTISTHQYAEERTVDIEDRDMLSADPEEVQSLIARLRGGL